MLFVICVLLKAVHAKWRARYTAASTLSIPNSGEREREREGFAAGLREDEDGVINK